MDPIYEWGIRLIAWLQQAAPWLSSPMRLFSFLGNEEFFFLFLPFLYWCVDARLGISVGVMLSFSDSLKSFLKLAFHTPRPYWVSSQVQALSHEIDYGLPSGHAQNAAAIWGTVATFGRIWLRWLMVVLILLIGLSRIFLAVHLPTDVLAGWLIGGLLLWAFVRWEAPILAWFKRKTLAQKLGLAWVTSLLLIALPFVGLTLAPSADPPDWEINAARAAPPLPGQPAINPRDMTRIVGVGGSFFGLAAGVILLFRQTHFEARGQWWKRIARYVIGVIGVVIVWRGLQVVLPRDATLVPQLLRYLRYALTGFWVAYGAPQVFIKLKL